MDWDLLEKTTFWIEDVELENANLGKVAEVAAESLGLHSTQVMVVDVRPGLLSFDLLTRQIKAEAVIGQERQILDRLGAIPGVKLGEQAAVHSEGVLGLIALPPEMREEVLTRSADLSDQIAQAVSKRAVVFASGAEVIAGKIEDTNSPFILDQLARHGFKAKFGGILDDNANVASARLEEAVGAGYGLVITTGGVGAEDKDFSIEAIQLLDPQAHTPWILKFTPDYHRHHKEEVRIAVGKLGLSLLIALPGPHEEARLGCMSLLEALAKGLDSGAVADSVAEAIRERWRQFNK